MSLTENTLILIGNAPCHPENDELKGIDNVFTSKLYSNNTANVIRLTKLNYINRLFEKASDFDSENIIPLSELRLQIANNASNIQLIAKLPQQILEEITTTPAKRKFVTNSFYNFYPIKAKKQPKRLKN
ncbi:unnamed protein product [Ceratitis capitata]|uniref:(Mediterranean fruit fly) hypothetical protein n=1 Tax=Ceratitis capitata TaxID=7213 RepID=A0A811UHQ1_CERCA|nr:unnamed protein product [Ceratitis capitata]